MNIDSILNVLTSLVKKGAGNDWLGCMRSCVSLSRSLFLKRKDITHLELGDVEIKPGLSGCRSNTGLNSRFCAAQRSVLDPRCSEADDSD